MKITEIEFGTGKMYVDEYGIEWEVHPDTLLNLVGRNIKDFYTLAAILSMNFEEQVDWSKVEVDTPILVSNNGTSWIKRHFAKYENGIVFGFGDGQTFWTGNSFNIIEYKYAKLGDEK